MATGFGTKAIFMPKRKKEIKLFIKTHYKPKKIDTNCHTPPLSSWLPFFIYIDISYKFQNMEPST